jgi:hypothetical protein
MTVTVLVAMSNELVNIMNVSMGNDVIRELNNGLDKEI